MNTPAKFAGFLAAIAAIFGFAVLGGRVVGPSGEPATDEDVSSHSTHGSAQDDDSAGDDSAEEIPGGLMVSQDGYTLALAESRVRAGAGRPVRFTVTGPDGTPVTEYEVEHEKELHLIAVRRDFTGFQHVHPTLDASTGLWSVDLDLTPGTWRLFADFRAAGAEALTLGTDLAVDGEFQPAPPAQETRSATVDGYQVSLDGDLVAGADAKLTLSVTKDGKPVTDLQPYLGAYGHLVALRGGDLAYLHVHPDGNPSDATTQPGPDVVFHAAVPSAGTFHLYLDFLHDDVVRTAAFTVTAGGAAQTPTPAEHGSHSGH